MEVNETSLRQVVQGIAECNSKCGRARTSKSEKIKPEPVGKERYGSDERVDGKETVGNSMGRAPVERSDTGVTTGWTEGKPWKRREGGRKGKSERYGSNERVDGGETVGNSMVRAPKGRSDTEAARGWREGKPCEIAWGELRWEGTIRKQREGGRTGNRGK